jgi:hypothetical protein
VTPVLARGTRLFSVLEEILEKVVEKLHVNVRLPDARGRSLGDHSPRTAPDVPTRVGDGARSQP